MSVCTSFLHQISRKLNKSSRLAVTLNALARHESAASQQIYAGHVREL